MKILGILTCMIFMVACASQKEVVDETNQSTVDAIGEGLVVGKVHTCKTGCLVYIEIIEDGKTVKMYPVNLEEIYKVDKLKIKFSYNLSRAMQPENCQVDKVVSVENVSTLP